MAQIIEPGRGNAGAGPGLSYVIGTKVLDQPLLMPLAGAQQLKGAIDNRVFDNPAGVISLAPRMNAFTGSDVGRSRYRVTDDGIAIVPVAGMLFDRGEWLGSLGGYATSYEGLAEQFRRIIKDTSIKAVILDIDSGGGMAAGCFDLCGEMSKLRAAKKVYAIAQNDACSGAYAIGCSAHEFYVTGLGRAGSIGAVSIHMSYQRMLDQSGIDATIIHTGQHKPNGNPYQSLTHTARAEMVSQIDQITATFVKHVSKARGISEETVRGFEAAVFLGQKAVEAGLADGVKTFDELVHHITKGKSVKASSASTRVRQPSTTGDRAMPDENTAVQAPDYDQVIAAALSMIAAAQPKPQTSATPSATPAVHPPAHVHTPAQVAVTPAVQATTQVSAPSAPETPAQTDVSRIWGIIDCDAGKSRPGLAKHLAQNTSVSVADAVAILNAAPVENTASAPQSSTQQGLANALDQRMAQGRTSAGVRPDGGGDGKGKGPTSISDFTKAKHQQRA